MRCHAVQQRLVAYQDDELSPGEWARVHDHLTRCCPCHADEGALFGATPHADLLVPWHLQRRLEEAVDTDILWALAQRRPAPTVASRLTRWWCRDTPLSRVAIAAYAGLLVGALMWGAANWWSLSTLEAEIARFGPRVEQGSGIGLRPPAGADIPAQQFRPAAYTPDDEGGYR